MQIVDTQKFLLLRSQAAAGQAGLHGGPRGEVRRREKRADNRNEFRRRERESQVGSSSRSSYDSGVCMERMFYCT